MCVFNCCLTGLGDLLWFFSSCFMSLFLAHMTECSRDFYDLLISNSTVFVYSAGSSHTTFCHSTHSGPNLTKMRREWRSMLPDCSKPFLSNKQHKRGAFLSLLSQQGWRHHYSLQFRCPFGRLIGKCLQHWKTPDCLDIYTRTGWKIMGYTSSDWPAGELLPLLSSPLLSFPRLATPPTLTAAATTSAASTFQIAIFVTVFIDVEKAIIWASRSGNRVLVGVGQRQSLFLEISPSQGCRGQWVPTWESQRSLLAVFSTSTLEPVVFTSKDNTSRWLRAVQALGSLYCSSSERHAQHVGCWLLPEN